MITEFSITSRVGPENSRLNPRSMVTLATTATITAGNTAMTENRLTIWMCSLAAARPRRRAWTTSQTSRTMMPINSRMIAALIRRKETTTTRVGSIRVRPVSTTKVRNVDNSANPTANGASNLRRDHPLDSANDGSNDAAEVSALVIPANGELKALRPPEGGLMHSYHIVAKLRQFRGASCRQKMRIPARIPAWQGPMDANPGRGNP